LLSPFQEDQQLLLFQLPNYQQPIQHHYIHQFQHQLIQPHYGFQHKQHYYQQIQSIFQLLNYLNGYQQIKLSPFHSTQQLLLYQLQLFQHLYQLYQLLLYHHHQYISKPHGYQSMSQQHKLSLFQVFQALLLFH